MVVSVKSPEFVPPITICEIVNGPVPVVTNSYCLRRGAAANVGGGEGQTRRSYSSGGYSNSSASKSNCLFGSRYISCVIGNGSGWRLDFRLRWV